MKCPGLAGRPTDACLVGFDLKRFELYHSWAPMSHVHDLILIHT